jgi:hypothetical protein
MADITIDYKKMANDVLKLVSTPEMQKIINSDPSLKEIYEKMLNNPEEVVLFMSSLSQFMQEAEAASKKEKYLKELRSIIPDLYNLDEEIEKITAQIDDLNAKKQSLRQEYAKKLQEFSNIKKELMNIPNIKEEIAKIPHAEKYINITSAQAKRIGKRVAQEGAMAIHTPRQVIDPLTGEIYSSNAEFCNIQIEKNKEIKNEQGVKDWDYTGDSAARVIKNNFRYWFLPATEENVDLVNNCLSTPPCIQELNNAVKTVRRNYELKQEPNELKREDILAILRKYKH